jgi:hypothetical protein
MVDNLNDADSINLSRSLRLRTPKRLSGNSKVCWRWFTYCRGDSFLLPFSEPEPLQGKDLDLELSHPSNSSSRSPSPPPTPPHLSETLDGKVLLYLSRWETHLPLLSVDVSHSLFNSSQSSTAETSGMVMTGPAPPPEDPSCPIKGMYRLLDLITEQGSSGLGNRFVVAGYTTLTISQSIRS